MRASRWYSVGVSVATALAGAFVMTGVAGADHDEPTQARLFSASLVRAFEPCGVGDANAETPGGLPACSPAVPVDDKCSMEGAGSKGRVDIKPTQHDLSSRVLIHGITGCEGERLILQVHLNVTTDNCVDELGEPLGENCTLAGPGHLTIPLGDCIVANGKCSMDNTLETLFPFIAASSGNEIGFSIDGCDIARAAGPNQGIPLLDFLRCGVLIP